MTRQYFTCDEPTYFERIDGMFDPMFEPADPGSLRSPLTQLELF